MTHQSNWGDSVQFNPKKGFRIHLIVFLLSIPAMWIVWYFINRTYIWPLWSMAAWGIGVLFHYLGVYVFKKS